MTSTTTTAAASSTKDDINWDAQYVALTRYKAIYGDCVFLPPFHYNEGAMKDLAQWTRTQRKNKSLLTEEQIHKLDQLGFDWESTTAKTATTPPPTTTATGSNSNMNSPTLDDDDDDNDSNQNDNYVPVQLQPNSVMTGSPNKNNDKYGTQDSYGLYLRSCSNEKRWFLMYEKLKAFRAVHGHCRVPVRWKRDPTLGKWVSRQRDTRKTLKEEKRQRLDDIGFEWCLKPMPSKQKLKPKKEEIEEELDSSQWTNHFVQLQNYMLKNKHSHVESDTELGAWAHQQRLLYAQQTLRDDRRQILESIQFDFNFSIKRSANEMAEALEEKDSLEWTNQFVQLQDFILEKGHSQVPDDTALGYWANQQRHLYAHQNLQEDRQQILESIQFDFQLLDVLLPKEMAEHQAKEHDQEEFNNSEWARQFLHLQDFVRKTGHSRIRNDTTLGQWAHQQRLLYAHQNLRRDRQKLLKSIQFDFQIMEAPPTNELAEAIAREEKGNLEWTKQFVQLQDFNCIKGHTQVPNNTVLGCWANKQRTLYAQKNLRKDRQQTLESIQFDFQLLENNLQERLPQKEGEQDSERTKRFVQLQKEGELESEWTKRFVQLSDYMHGKGHFSIPNDTELGSWANQQLLLYEQKKLREDRLQLLESIQFIKVQTPATPSLASSRIQVGQENNPQQPRGRKNGTTTTTTTNNNNQKRADSFGDNKQGVSNIPCPIEISPESKRTTTVPHSKLDEKTKQEPNWFFNAVMAAQEKQGNTNYGNGNCRSVTNELLPASTLQAIGENKMEALARHTATTEAGSGHNYYGRDDNAPPASTLHPAAVSPSKKRKGEGLVRLTNTTLSVPGLNGHDDRISNNNKMSNIMVRGNVSPNFRLDRSSPKRTVDASAAAALPPSSPNYHHHRRRRPKRRKGMSQSSSRRLQNCGSPYVRIQCHKDGFFTPSMKPMQELHNNNSSNHHDNGDKNKDKGCRASSNQHSNHAHNNYGDINKTPPTTMNMTEESISFARACFLQVKNLEKSNDRRKKVRTTKRTWRVVCN